MLIPIKIGKKKYKIKSIDELTTSEFVELTKIENINQCSDSEFYIKYIAWQTGFKTEDLFFVVISKTIERGIGKIPDIKKMKKSERFNYKQKIYTLGQRHQIEQSKLKGSELIVFSLAVAQAKSNDIDKVNELKESYMNENWKEIIPAGFFFYLNYINGKR